MQILFEHILTIASPSFRNFINENKRRYLAAQEVSQVAKSLEFAGKQAEAQALRCVESQMQALSSEHKIARAEMRGELQSTEHNVMAAISNLQTLITSLPQALVSGASQSVPSVTVPQITQPLPQTITQPQPSPILLPTDETSAKTFIPSADELDGYDRTLRRGHGCEQTVIWMQGHGRRISEQYGEEWWKQCSGLSTSVRNNILSKRYKRIKEIHDLVEKSAGRSHGATLRSHAATMDAQRSVGYPGMTLSTWLD